ncbi:MAG: agarase, partial [Planctomycetota bacterium]
AEFEEWCDYAARADCARMKDDPKLIGYFYTDCPIWIHSRRPENKPPIFDPELLTSEAGRKELFELATHYYRVTHDAIRRYDQNHLILGDRYEGRAPLAKEVLRAAVPFIDVLCFQNFGPVAEVAGSFLHWHEVTGLPVLLADAGGKKGGWQRDTYRHKIKTLRELPCCVGWHLCGAYLRNHVRQAGVRDQRLQPDQRFIDEMTAANRETADFVRRTADY